MAQTLSATIGQMSLLFRWGLLACSALWSHTDSLWIRSFAVVEKLPVLFDVVMQGSDSR